MSAACLVECKDAHMDKDDQTPALARQRRLGVALALGRDGGCLLGHTCL